MHRGSHVTPSKADAAGSRIARDTALTGINFQSPALKFTNVGPLGQSKSGFPAAVHKR